MFDVGFSELVVIGVVALVVIGPERLPKVARTAGHLFGRFQRYVSTVKADIQREMDTEELGKLKSEFQDAARSVEAGMKEQMQSVEAEAHVMQQSLEQSAPAQPPKAGDGTTTPDVPEPSAVQAAPAQPPGETGAGDEYAAPATQQKLIG
jgi:sec-independent protein translocase protein TatB